MDLNHKFVRQSGFTNLKAAEVKAPIVNQPVVLFRGTKMQLGIDPAASGMRETRVINETT